VRALVAEDDGVARAITARAVEGLGWQVLAVADGAAALDALRADSGPELAVLDWMMPGLDGIEVARRVRAAALARYVYLVLLTARSARADALLALRAGVDDLLAKPLDEELLAARLEAGRRVLEALAAKPEAAQDPVTQLPSRGATAARLAVDAGRCARAGEPMSIALVDVLRLRSLNAEQGRAAGDAVLRAVAYRLRLALRENDGLGRYGPSEFLAILPGCDRSGAERCAERLEARLAGLAGVRVCIGCATSTSPEAELDLFVPAADAALRRAKTRPPRGWAVATPDDWRASRT
jgi:diguanylate cyclase (GGDEF)-like protein